MDYRLNIELSIISISVIGSIRKLRYSN